MSSSSNPILPQAQIYQQPQIDAEQQLRQPNTPVLSSSNFTLYSTASISPSKISFDEQRLNNILNSNNKLINQKHLSLSNLTDGSPKIINRNLHSNISVFTQNGSSQSFSTALSSDKSPNNSNNRIRKTFGRLCVFNPLKQLQLIHCNVKNKTSKEKINAKMMTESTVNGSSNEDCQSRKLQAQATSNNDNGIQEIKTEQEQNSLDQSVLIGSHRKFFKSTSVDYYV